MCTELRSAQFTEGIATEFQLNVDCTVDARIGCRTSANRTIGPQIRTHTHRRYRNHVIETIEDTKTGLHHWPNKWAYYWIGQENAATARTTFGKRFRCRANDDFYTEGDIRNATKLSHLIIYVENTIEIDVVDYMEMLGAVRNRPKKVHLMIIGDENTVQVPVEILMENRESLNSGQRPATITPSHVCHFLEQLRTIF